MAHEYYPVLLTPVAAEQAQAAYITDIEPKLGNLARVATTLGVELPLAIPI